ncbi:MULTISPECIES: nuclear transport factor 2 family protein [unclassified Lysobacter]|uniref:nuclear transport factor 2 family protein n=1 Tax=unclassified Lysobacter TaxID=2635362 RepID=UPI001C23428E|nr:nuclear transport factor 2 family protein [Lysobacter sp. MMG2]MBU8977938.1 nuclear transport factor 2 family protein [Lysobacter sp. MMG2]
MGKARGWVRAAMALWWVPGLVLLLAACGRTPPEERLRGTLAELHTAIEKKDAAALDDVLAEDFVGPGALDRDGARRMAQLMFLRYGAVGANIGPVSIELQPGHATASFNVALTGGSGQLLPEAARLYDVRTGWREVDGEWRMTSAEWDAKL